MKGWQIEFVGQQMLAERKDGQKPWGSGPPLPLCPTQLTGSKLNCRECLVDIVPTCLEFHMEKRPPGRPLGLLPQAKQPKVGKPPTDPRQRFGETNKSSAKQRSTHWLLLTKLGAIHLRLCEVQRFHRIILVSPSFLCCWAHFQHQFNLATRPVF